MKMIWYVACWFHWDEVTTSTMNNIASVFCGILMVQFGQASFKQTLLIQPKRQSVWPSKVTKCIIDKTSIIYATKCSNFSLGGYFSTLLDTNGNYTGYGKLIGVLKYIV